MTPGTSPSCPGCSSGRKEAPSSALAGSDSYLFPARQTSARPQRKKEIVWVFFIAFRKKQRALSFALRVVYLRVTPDGAHGRLPAQGSEVRPHVSHRRLSQLRHVHAGGHRHPLAQHPQDGLPLLLGGCSQDHLRQRDIAFIHVHIHAQSLTLL